MVAKLCIFFGYSDIRVANLLKKRIPLTVSQSLMHDNIAQIGNFPFFWVSLLARLFALEPQNFMGFLRYGRGR